MSHFNWRSVVGKPEDANGHLVLALLYQAEQFFLRMLHGIVLFFRESMPDAFWWIVEWLHWILHFGVRVVIRLGRVALIGLAWFVIVFGPLAWYPGFITITWTILTLIGSVWGLRRQIRSRAMFAESVSENERHILVQTR